MKAVLDASPIIAFFDELEDPETLLLTRRLGYELLVPDYVGRRDIVKEPSVSLLARCITEEKISILGPADREELNRFQRIHPSLGAGESEVIIAVRTFRSAGQDARCVLDERPARRIAQSLGLPVIGTLGLIDALRQADLIDEARRNELAWRLRGSTFRLDERLLR